MKFVALAVILAMPEAGMAMQTTYICHLNVPRSEGWIPDQMVIVHDVQTGQVVIADPISNHFTGQPVAGRVARENDKRISFVWTLKGIRNSIGQTTVNFDYRASIGKSDGVITVSAEPSGYSNEFSARGTCLVQ